MENPSFKEPLSFSNNEIAKHCTADDCWIIYRSKVYDVSAYLKSNVHPSGNHSIIEWAGQDCTAAFDQAGKINTDCHKLKVSRWPLSVN